MAGEQELSDTLRERFREEIVKGSGPDFVEAKLTERDERHQLQPEGAQRNAHEFRVQSLDHPRSSSSRTG